jgi:hypothetical protein
VLVAIYFSADKDFVFKKVNSSRCSFRREVPRKSLELRQTCRCLICGYGLLIFIADTEVPRRGKSNINVLEETRDGNTD